MARVTLGVGLPLPYQTGAIFLFQKAAKVLLTTAIQTDSTFRAKACCHTLIPDEGPLLETSNLFVSVR